MDVLFFCKIFLLFLTYYMHRFEIHILYILYNLHLNYNLHPNLQFTMKININYKLLLCTLASQECLIYRCVISLYNQFNYGIYWRIASFMLISKISLCNCDTQMYLNWGGGDVLKSMPPIRYTVLHAGSVEQNIFLLSFYSLSIFLSIYISIYLSIYLSIFLSIYLSI